MLVTEFEDELNSSILIDSRGKTFLSQSGEMWPISLQESVLFMRRLQYACVGSSSESEGLYAWHSKIAAAISPGRGRSMA